MRRPIKIIIITAVVANTSCTRSPTGIFEAIFNTAPKSVRVLHGQDQYLFDCCLWLHFSIDKKDLEKILAARYELKETDFGLWKNVLPPGVDWWKPEKLGASALYYTKDSEKTIESLFTNVEMTEVYYVNYLK